MLSALGGTTLLTNSDFTYNNEIGWDGRGRRHKRVRVLAYGSLRFLQQAQWAKACQTFPWTPISDWSAHLHRVPAQPESEHLPIYCWGDQPIFAVGARRMGAAPKQPREQTGVRFAALYKNAKALPNVTSGPGFHDIIGGLQRTLLRRPWLTTM